MALGLDSSFSSFVLVSFPSIVILFFLLYSLVGVKCLLLTLVIVISFFFLNALIMPFFPLFFYVFPCCTPTVSVCFYFN